MHTTEIYFIVVLIILWITVSALATIFLLGRGGKRSRVMQRLEAIKRSGLRKTAVFEDDRKSNFFVDTLISCGKLVYPPKKESARKSIDKELHAAGIYSEKALYILMGMRVLLPISLLLTAILSTLLTGSSLTMVLASAACAILLGYGVPLILLRYMARNRRRALMRGFPDALDLLAVCTEAGVGFDSAIKKVAEEMALTHKDIAKEFMSYLYEPQMGIPRHEALRNMAERMDVDIIRSFVAVLIQSDKLGTSIANTLRVYADSLRTKRRQDAEVKAARLPVLIVFPLLFLIFPTLYIVILGPAVITISKNLIGKIL